MALMRRLGAALGESAAVLHNEIQSLESTTFIGNQDIKGQYEHLSQTLEKAGEHKRVRPTITHVTSLHSQLKTLNPALNALVTEIEHQIADQEIEEKEQLDFSRNILRRRRSQLKAFKEFHDIWAKDCNDSGDGLREGVDSKKVAQSMHAELQSIARRLQLGPFSDNREKKFLAKDANARVNAALIAKYDVLYETFNAWCRSIGFKPAPAPSHSRPIRVTFDDSARREHKSNEREDGSDNHLDSAVQRIDAAASNFNRKNKKSSQFSKGQIIGGLAAVAIVVIVDAVLSAVFPPANAGKVWLYSILGGVVSSLLGGWGGSEIGKAIERSPCCGGDNNSAYRSSTTTITSTTGVDPNYVGYSRDADPEPHSSPVSGIDAGSRGRPPRTSPTVAGLPTAGTRTRGEQIGAVAEGSAGLSNSTGEFRNLTRRLARQ